MKKPKSIILRLAILIAVAFLLYLGGMFIVFPSYILATTSRLVAEALHDAQSVTITELVTYRDLLAGDTAQREVVIRTISASPEQISQFRRATGGFLDFGLPRARTRCFEPHHRIDVLRADGTPFRLDVCFFCSNIRFNGHGPRSIPPAWVPRLKRFFTNLGMPPRTLDEYAKFKPANTM